MAEKPRELALVVHFHQPRDNLERVLRHAAERCYRPFLEVAEAHPEVPWTLHFSGCLLEWLEAELPELPERLQRMVASDQVELLTGGMEEPILAAIPEPDRRSQIERMSAHLGQVYGARPQGLWLTERVWEPELARNLAELGLGYTVLDDTIFRAVGVDRPQQGQPWVTDHQGHPLRLFASDRQLRYLIPYARPQRVLAQVRSSPPGSLSVYADDGEKFGEWPRTHPQVYGRRWLERFLEALQLESSQGRLRLLRLGEAAGRAPGGRVHLPSSSYDEMMVWALPTPSRRRLELAGAALTRSDPLGIRANLRGAPWHAFLSKYPEVARLQQAMLSASSMVEAAGSPPEALRELHRAQCNCGYWHGTFGGAYLTFLRLPLWQHLIRARQLAGETPAASPRPARAADLDADGVEEVRLEGPWGWATVAPQLGGQVMELVGWEAAANLIGTMGRHREAYHLAPIPAAAPRADLELAPLEAEAVPGADRMEFDELEVGALRDRLGETWLDRPYQARLQGAGVELRCREGAVELSKQISAGQTGLEVTYCLKSTANFRGILSVELRGCPLAPGRKADSVRLRTSRRGWLLDQPGCQARLRLRAEPSATVESSRLVAHGSTLNGLEEMVQGMRLVVSWQLAVSPGKPWTGILELLPEAVPGGPARNS